MVGDHLRYSTSAFFLSQVIHWPHSVDAPNCDVFLPCAHLFHILELMKHRLPVSHSRLAFVCCSPLQEECLTTNAEAVPAEITLSSAGLQLNPSAKRWHFI